MIETTIKAIAASMLLLAVGCSNDEFSATRGSKVEVILPVSRSVDSRTEIEPDGVGVRWSIGDEVALWADGATTNSPELTGESFTLRYFGDDYQTAEFAATVSEMTSDAEYNYSALYPYPAVVLGKMASYDLVSTQSGEYDGVLDIRRAATTLGAPLAQSSVGGTELSFESMVHALKIYIPAGYNKLDAPIKRFVITFPESVAGVLLFDMSDTSVAPTLSEGVNQIIIDRSDNPVEAGSDEAVWLFMSPISVESGVMTITALDVNNRTGADYSIDLSGHTFSAGHITPIYTEVGEALQSTTLRFTIGSNNLGEDLESINLKAPEGAIFTESLSRHYKAPNDGSNIFTASYIESASGDAVRGGTIEVDYESKSALLTDLAGSDIVGSTLTAGEVNTFTKDIPYLFAEDFSAVTALSSQDATGVGGVSRIDDSKLIYLKDYGLRDGWQGAQIGAAAKAALRICSRYEYGMRGAFNADQDGWVDSPALKGLKSGATITVSYKYKGGKHTGGNGEPEYSHGYGGVQSAKVGIYGTGSASGTKVVGAKALKCSSSSSQSYANGYATHTYVINNKSLTSSSRLSWRVANGCTEKPFFGVNGNYWLYIDDIKVQVGDHTTKE